MLSQDNPLRPIYSGWEAYQGHLIRTLAPLTAAHLALRPAAHLRSIGEIAEHIAAGRARSFHHALDEGSAATMPLLAQREHSAPAPTASELVSGLEVTWRDLAAALARWTPQEATQPLAVTVNGVERTVARLWVIWHLIEHDLHHGGELAFSLGLQGLPAPDL